MYSSSATNISTVNWPKGINTNFLILPVPNISETVIARALEYICGNCYYFDKEHVKKTVVVPGINPSKQLLSKSIQMEALFQEAVGDCANNQNLLDYHRLQSHPSRQTSLLKSDAISTIATMTQNVINAQVDGYVMNKISVLFSLPYGKPQGLHVDDVRSPSEITCDGEMLGVIFALQNGTKLDIGTSYDMCLTYSIPAASIFLFSGKCWHRGSAYMTNNVRIHMTFIPSHLSKKKGVNDNLIPVGLKCPVIDCKSNDGRLQTFTKEQLYNHWRLKHQQTYHVSLGKYLKSQEGINVIQCPDCKKGFTSTDGLKIHQRSKCKLRKAVSY
jgi:hypothetical protein